MINDHMSGVILQCLILRKNKVCDTTRNFRKLLSYISTYDFIYLCTWTKFTLVFHITFCLFRFSHFLTDISHLYLKHIHEQWSRSKLGIVIILQSQSRKCFFLFSFKIKKRRFLISRWSLWKFDSIQSFTCWFAPVLLISRSFPFKLAEFVAVNFPRHQWISSAHGCPALAEVW